jgi:hypothetical protein
LKGFPNGVAEPLQTYHNSYFLSFNMCIFLFRDNRNKPA